MRKIFIILMLTTILFSSNYKEIKSCTIDVDKPALYVTNKIYQEDLETAINIFEDSDILIRVKLHNQRIVHALYIININKNSLSMIKDVLRKRGYAIKEIIKSERVYYYRNRKDKDYIFLKGEG